MINGDVVTIENAFVGAKVYSYSRNKWGEIHCIYEDDPLPLGIKFEPSYYTEFFSKNGGRYSEDSNPDLFWGEPEIIAPPKPKRLVEKTLWGNLYENKNDYTPYFMRFLYETKEKALAHKILDTKYIDTVSIKFSVEE